MGGLFVILLLVGTIKAVAQHLAMRKVSVVDLSSPVTIPEGKASPRRREGAAGLVGMPHSAESKTRLSDGTPSSEEAREP